MRRPDRLRRRRIHIVVLAHPCGTLRRWGAQRTRSHSTADSATARQPPRCGGLGCPASHRLSVCLLLISQKIAKFFEIAPKYARKKKKSTISENLFFAEICSPLPRFAGAPTWSLLLLRSTLLALRPSLRRPYRQKMNTYRYSFSSFCFCGFASLAMLAHAAVAAGGRALCSALPQCSPPVFLWLPIVYMRLAVCRFRVVSRRPRGGAQKPVSGIHYGSVFYFSPCPSAFCQRYHKKFFLSNHAVIRHYQNCTNDKLNYLTAGFDKKNFLWYKSLIDGKGKSKHTVSDTTVISLCLRTSDGRPLAPRSGSGGAPHKKK